MNCFKEGLCQNHQILLERGGGYFVYFSKRMVPFSGYHVHLFCHSSRSSQQEMLEFPYSFLKGKLQRVAAVSKRNIYTSSFPRFL